MAITYPKLSQLRLSPLNQRQVKPTAIESMADDIDAHGLIQNLVAYEEDGLFYVFAGGRRYRGLKLLAKRKRIKNSATFPVEVRDKSEAIELSLIENEQREASGPMGRSAIPACPPRISPPGQGSQSASSIRCFAFPRSHRR
jgi:ParB family chromosome partitioning protein